MEYFFSCQNISDQYFNNLLTIRFAHYSQCILQTKSRTGRIYRYKHLPADLYNHKYSCICMSQEVNVIADFNLPNFILCKIPIPLQAKLGRWFLPLYTPIFLVSFLQFTTFSIWFVPWFLKQFVCLWFIIDNLDCFFQNIFPEFGFLLRIYFVLDDSQATHLQVLGRNILWFVSIPNGYFTL